MKDNTVTKAEVIITNNTIDEFTGKFTIRVYDLSGEEIAVDAQLIKSLEQDRDQTYKWKDEEKEKLEKENRALGEQLIKARQDLANMKYSGQDLMRATRILGRAVIAFPINRRRSNEYKLIKENWENIASPNNFKQFK